MNEKQKNNSSRFLSLVLRHKPETIGIQLDENGWVSVDILLKKMNTFGKKIDFKSLENMVETNNKKRFAFNEDKTKIRANQGHSIKVKLGYEAQKPPKILFHGTASRFVESILRTGLEKRNRHHVHLSKDKDTAINVGSRHGKPVIFEVMAEEMYENGSEFFISQNGVWLTDNVPSEYLRLIQN
jgi:putative RNA 2'-phosphotransferase